MTTNTACLLYRTFEPFSILRRSKLNRKMDEMIENTIADANLSIEIEFTLSACIYLGGAHKYIVCISGDGHGKYEHADSSFIGVQQ